MPAVWTTPDEVQLICPDATDDEALEGPCALASAILYALTGERWPGPQADVTRPCSPLRGATYPYPPPPLGGPAPGWPLPVPAGLGWCGCASPTVCGCAAPGTVQLPGAPATSVERVTLDALELAPEAYRLMGQLLIRVDGRDWPCCQDWQVPGNAPGAFEVRYTWGQPVPDEGRYLASVLACELWKATPAAGAAGSGCRLPKRVTTLSRQGVQMTLLDPLAMFPDGLTGIPEVDLWLSSQRYGLAHRPATVMVPGARARHLRDTPAP